MPVDSERIARLEWKCEQCESVIEEIRKEHRSEVLSLKTMIEQLWVGLNDIRSLIRSIKWLLIGAIVYALIDQIGLMAFAVKLFGI